MMGENMGRIQSNIEEISWELDEDYSDDSLFNIASWGADLSFRELCSMYDEDELAKPELQRNYVWNRAEASKFVESILLGLPVPSIFLAQNGSQKLIVDGFQRIMTVYFYIYNKPFPADQKPFKLVDSEKINVRWRNKAFCELSSDDQRRIKSSTIHAIIFEQKNPKNDDTSLYQIFERINTGGRTLTPQEIRNCVYQGKFNSLLFQINENPIWRELFGTNKADSRMRDMEYILRFFAIKELFDNGLGNSKTGQISLKKTLNDFMQKHRSDDDEKIGDFREEFEETIEFVYDYLGINAFRNYRGKFTKKFHPAIFDAVMVAASSCKNGQGKKGLEIDSVEERHVRLLEDAEFQKDISQRTTDIESIEGRISCAMNILFGVRSK